MLFLSVQAGASALSLDVSEICLRLLCAMLVGLVIGTEREYTNRPAGMRTHILVALGASVVTITGQMIFAQYSAYGSLPDPARLSAQVITGVGFLGAGTILREGTTVKGLTTAASVWAVACLGIAAGFGYSTVALTGMVFIFITLTIFEIFQHKLVGSHAPAHPYILQTRDISAALEAINTHANACRTEVRGLKAQPLTDGMFQICFQAEFVGMQSKKRRARFFARLAADPAVTAVQEDLFSAC